MRAMLVWVERLRELPGRLAPKGFAGRPGELGVAVTAAGLVVLLAAAEFETGPLNTISALAVVPVVALAWLVRPGYLVAVTALAALLQVVLALNGQVVALTAASDVVTLALLATATHLAAANLSAAQALRGHELSVLVDLGATIGKAIEPDEVFAEIVRLAVSLVTRPGKPAPRATLFRVEGGYLRPMAEYDALGWHFPIDLPLQDHGPISDCYRESRPVRARLEGSTGQLGELVRSAGVRSAGYAPVRFAGRVAGVLSVVLREGRELTTAELALVSGMADVAGLAIQNVEAAREARTAALTSFQDVTGRMVASLELDDTLDAVTRAVTGITRSDVGAIFLLDAEAGSVRARKVAGNRTRLWYEFEQPRESGITGRALKSGDIQRVDDYSQPAAEGFPASVRIAEAEGLRSVAVVPLIRRGRRLGVVGAYRRRLDPYTDGDVFLLKMLADHASIALDNARTYGELDVARRRSESLLRFTEQLWRPLPLRETAEVVADEARRLLPEINCLVNIAPPGQNDHFQVIAGTGEWGAAMAGKRLRLAGTVAERAILDGRAQETTNLTTGNPNAAILAAGDINTARLIPLTGGQPLSDGRQALGVLGFYRAGRRPFTTDERELMDELGIRAGLALHRAELLELARQATERLRAGIDLTVELAGALESGQLIPRLLRRAVDALHADRAVLARIQGSEVVITDVYDRRGQATDGGARYQLATRPAVREAAQTRVVVFAEPERFGMREDVRRAYEDISHTAVVPLVMDEAVAAVLIVGRRGENPFGEGDREMLELIGNGAAIALRNASLYAQTQEASRAKSDFLNLAAHELRTPLSVVSGYLSMLQDGSLGGEPPPQWVRPLNVMVSKVRELGDLVDDLLMAARLEAGTLSAGRERADLRLLVREALARVEPRARLLDASVEKRLPADPVEVLVDPEHVGRVLDNLLNNALTYSTGRPWVRVTVSADPAAVTIEDRGFGIPEAARERIFERFYRAEEAGTPHPPGTGLGLFISRSLAETNGGRLELVESEVGKGSVFQVVFGQEEAAALRAERPAGQDPAAESR